METIVVLVGCEYGENLGLIARAMKNFGLKRLLLVKPTADIWILMAICLLAIPAGVWLGWRLHGSLDQRQIYRACYGLLVATALKLLWDGASGYL